MKRNEIISIALKTPLLILVIAAFFASIYAAYNKISGITYSSSVFLFIIITLYFVGFFLGRKKPDF